MGVDASASSSPAQERVIELYQFPPHPDMPLPVSTSPFCAKLEAYLRLTKRPYVARNGSPLKSPAKTVPYVERGVGVGLEADSADIIATLEAEGPSLDSEVVRKDALVKELTELAEERMYFTILYACFVQHDGWKEHVAGVKASLPFVLRPLLCGRIRRGQIKKAAQHGCTNDTTAFAASAADVARLAQVLSAVGGDGFLLGSDPHVVDCSVYAMLLAAAYITHPNPLTDAIRAQPVVMRYIERMTDAVGFDSLPAPRYIH